VEDDWIEKAVAVIHTGKAPSIYGYIERIF
jgi:hypothetical protein